MAAKKATKKAPAKKAGAFPAKAGSGDLEFTDHLDARRPFAFNENEWKLIDGVVKGHVEGTEQYRTEDVRQLLKTCAAFLRAGAAPPEPAASWLSLKLDEIASLDSPWGVALVNRQKGSGNADDYYEQMLVAAYFQQLRSEGEKIEVCKRLVVEKLEPRIPDLTGSKAYRYWLSFYKNFK